MNTTNNKLLYHERGGHRFWRGDDGGLEIRAPGDATEQVDLTRPLEVWDHEPGVGGVVMRLTPYPMWTCVSVTEAKWLIDRYGLGVMLVPRQRDLRADHSVHLQAVRCGLSFADEAHETYERVISDMTERQSFYGMGFTVEVRPNDGRTPYTARLLELCDTDDGESGVLCAVLGDDYEPTGEERVQSLWGATFHVW